MIRFLIQFGLLSVTSIAVILTAFTAWCRSAIVGPDRRAAKQLQAMRTRSVIRPAPARNVIQVQPTEVKVIER